ncbi:MAG TPA: serine/threonine-protein kinase, partial [Candidatus Paceibacterota bacterium]|nr:serine/threonine-protein kinase [Candidatus Paceibacterota bacterium]
MCEFAGALEASPWAPTGQPALPLAPVRMGDYELGEEIARGGMGVVYKARQISLNRTVALKMILAGEFAGPKFVQRFRTEAEAAAKLHHPNIVAIHEIGEHEGRHFFSMDCVDGPSLQDAVRREPFSPKRAATCVRTLAEAVHYAHQQGVLHRDLKPSNVLLGPDDQPMITDFGLAKVLTSDTELTMSGQILGTPGYLPPEQASGHRGKVGLWSDVYSLGGLLYYLLTSRPPFQAQDVTDVLDQVLNREPVSPRLFNPSVPRDIETICLKCLEKDPARRYASARALAEDLGRYLQGETIMARPLNRPEKVWRWCRRKPALAGALAACAVALLLGFIGISWQWRRAEGEAQAARRSLYDSDLLLAQQAFDENNFGRVERLLNKHDPRYSERTGEDLRGWEWHYLWGQIQSDELYTLGSHSNTVNYLTFSPDGRWLASASHYEFGNNVKIWDLRERRLAASLPIERVQRVNVMAFAPDSRTLAVADQG